MCIAIKLLFYILIGYLKTDWDILKRKSILGNFYNVNSLIHSIWNVGFENGHLSLYLWNPNKATGRDCLATGYLYQDIFIWKNRIHIWKLRLEKVYPWWTVVSEWRDLIRPTVVLIHLAKIIKLQFTYD